MDHQSFIFAAFVVAGIGMLGLIWSSYSAMRKSEALADDLRRDV
jgi:hypothetical protein